MALFLWELVRDACVWMFFKFLTQCNSVCNITGHFHGILYPTTKKPKPKYKAEMLIYQTLIRRRKTNKWCEGNRCQQTHDEEWLPWADSSLVLSQSLILCGLGYPFGQLRSRCPLLCPSCPPCSLWRGRVGNGGDLGAQQSPKHS